MRSMNFRFRHTAWIDTTILMLCLAVCNGSPALADETTGAQAPTATTADEKPPEMPDVDLDKVLAEPEAGATATDMKQGEVKVDVTVPDAQATPTDRAAAVGMVKPPAVKSIDPNLPPMVFVQKSYKEGRYRDALVKLSGIKPQSDKTHYWAGLCYQGQGQLQKAQMEFNWVASFSKNPQLKYNASLALRTVSRYGSSRSYGGQGNGFARYNSYSAPSGGGGMPTGRG